MATYGTGDRRQNRLSRLLKKMIQGKQFMGMKRLDEINEALKKKARDSAGNFNAKEWLQTMYGDNFWSD